jgi:FKBP-type peptidyl-prolyl cis-trans isomerase
MQKFLAIAALGFWFALASPSFSQDELPAGGGAVQRNAGPATTAPQTDANTYRQQVGYALGRNFAQNLRDNQIQCDLNALLAGIKDVLTNAEPKWTDEQLQPTMVRFSQEMQQKAVARMEQEAAKNKQEADAFLARNAKVEGVQTTASGLQYRVLKQAEGPSPTMNDTVRCHYRGTLLDGTEFDSSAQHGGPAEFRVGPPLIEGWVEALQKMRVGERWQLFVPPNLAYKTQSPGAPIGPNSMLVFEIELLEILPQ